LIPKTNSFDGVTGYIFPPYPLFMLEKIAFPIPDFSDAPMMAMDFGERKTLLDAPFDAI
jgi:hypothetical protein